MLDLNHDNGPLPQSIAVGMIPVIKRIACHLARRLPPHICVDDLMSVGFVGLVTAYRRFESTRGDDFRAYAEVRIRGAMIDELRTGDPLTRGMRAHANRAAAAKKTVEARTGKAADGAAIAAELGLSLDAYHGYAAKSAVGGLVSLDSAADGELTLQLRDESAVPADEQLHLEQSKRAAREALESLSPRLRKVVELYYGSEMTLREIGEVLGVTESRVCQLQGEALQHMREHCRVVLGGTEARPASNVRKVPRAPRAIVAREPRAVVAREPRAVVAREPRAIVAGEPLTIVAREPRAIVAGEPLTIVTRERLAA
jgi:RNA polymerase sigma factor for flagellar operon FliA